MRTARGAARPRAGLLGNPSDLYGGRGLGFCFDHFEAVVEAEESSSPEFPSALLRAAYEAYAQHTGAREPVRLRGASDIPRQVGLAGSSALVVAALRALAAFFHAPLAEARLADLALQAESEILGIRAGAMDRLIQAHEGLVWMDFADSFAPGAVERLDPGLLPPMRIAHDLQSGRDSGAVHEPVWQRWQRGEIGLHKNMEALAALADEGLAALRAGDHASLRRCVDRNFELRARVFPISLRDRRMIEIGRLAGAAAKFCGSGGAALFVLSGAEDLPALKAALEKARFRMLEPRVAIPRK